MNQAAQDAISDRPPNLCSARNGLLHSTMVEQKAGNPLQHKQKQLDIKTHTQTNLNKYTQTDTFTQTKYMTCGVTNGSISGGKDLRAEVKTIG